MLFSVDLDEYPDAKSFTDLDDDEIHEVIREAERAKEVAEMWLEAAWGELTQRSYRRMQPRPTLHERLRAAEQRRLRRRRSKSRR